MRDLRVGASTRRAALGAADLERPAGEHRRPLAGMFRVQGLLGKSASCWNYGCLMGLFENFGGFLWDADDSSWGSRSFLRVFGSFVASCAAVLWLCVVFWHEVQVIVFDLRGEITRLS